MTVNLSRGLLLTAVVFFIVGAILALTGGALGPVTPSVAGLIGLAFFAAAGLA